MKFIYIVINLLGYAVTAACFWFAFTKPDQNLYNLLFLVASIELLVLSYQLFSLNSVKAAKPNSRPNLFYSYSDLICNMGIAFYLLEKKCYFLSVVYVVLAVGNNYYYRNVHRKTKHG